MPPYYLTTPIYYVNDAPHVGTAYTTVNADALARWHRLLGDDVWFMTGTDEHGAKIVEAAEANGVTPKEWTDRTSARFVEAWSRLDISNDDFIRTTEPRHYAVVQQFLQRIYDNGFIELAPYSGLYCISCEDYYTEDQLVDGKCPVHGRPVVEMQEDNYFFKLSAFEQRLLDYYERASRLRPPGLQAQRGAGLHPRRAAGRLHHPDLVLVGRPGPLGQRPRLLRLVRRADQLPDRGRLRQRRGRFAARWGAAHHLSAKDILKFHCVWWPAMCMAAGIEPPAEIFVHGYLLMGGQKLGKTMIAAGLAGGDGERRCKITDVSPLALADDFGVDPLRYHLLREVPLGGDGDFSYEGIVARYNADLANNLGNLVSRVTTVVHSKCDGIGPAPDPDSELAVEAAGCSRRRRPPGHRWAPHEALEATWRLIGATNARLEAAEPWKMDPGPAVDAVLGDALEVLRIVAISGGPGHALDGGRDLAAHRRAPATRRRPGCPAARPGAATPAGPPWSRATRCSPGARPDGGWFDSHCHVQEEFREGEDGGELDPVLARARAGRGGAARLHRDRADHLGPGGGPGPAAAGRTGRRGRGPRSACTRTRRAKGSTTWPRCSSASWRAGDGAVVAVGECGLDYYYEHSPRDAQREAFAAQIALAHAHELALVIHARDAWDDLFDVLAAEGVPDAHRVALLHRRCRRGRPMPRAPACSSRSAASSRSRTRPTCAPPPPLSARPVARRDRQPVPRAGAATGVAPTSRRTFRTSARRSPRSRAAPSMTSWNGRPPLRHSRFPQGPNRGCSVQIREPCDLHV